MDDVKLKWKSLGQGIVQGSMTPLQRSLTPGAEDWRRTHDGRGTTLIDMAFLRDYSFTLLSFIVHMNHIETKDCMTPENSVGIRPPAPLGSEQLVRSVVLRSTLQQ